MAHRVTRKYFDKMKSQLELDKERLESNLGKMVEDADKKQRQLNEAVEQRVRLEKQVEDLTRIIDRVNTEKHMIVQSFAAIHNRMVGYGKQEKRGDQYEVSVERRYGRVEAELREIILRNTPAINTAAQVAHHLRKKPPYAA